MKPLVLAVWIAVPVFAGSLAVNVIYGGGKPEKNVVTEYETGMNALDVLKRVSRVETSQTGEFVFVRSIDGVRSVIGKYGWFYLIDGQPPGVIAQRYRLENAHTMTWYYGVEACY